MVALAEGRTRTISEESRTLLAKTAKKLDVQREVTRLTRNPAAGMMIRQLLFFDDKKKACDDYWIFKSAKQWEKDEGLTRQQVRTATRKLEEFGLAQVDRDRPDPLYNNITTFYRLDIYRVMQIVDPVKLAALEPELLYLEPDEATRDEFGVCERCGDEFCDGEGCLYIEDAHGWHDEAAPDPTDADAPEATINDLDWLPEGLMATDAEQINNQPLPPNQPTSTPESTNPLVESTNPMYRGTTTEELPQKNHKQKTSTLQVGEGRFRAPSPAPVFEEHEDQVATSPPPPDDSPGSEITEKVAALTPSTRTRHAPRQTVRDLLEPGGKLHPLVDDALAWGEQAAPILARYVSGELGGKPEEHVGAVKLALMAMWKSESEVAA